MLQTTTFLSSFSLVTTGLGEVSAGLAYGIGHMGSPAFKALMKNSRSAKGIAHGLARGSVARIQGQNFKSGFLSGLVGSVAGGIAHGIKNVGFAAKVTMTAIAGGLSSVAGGGKFANGAMSAAYVYMFNEAGRYWDEKNNSYNYHDSDSQEAARTSWETQIKNAYAQVGGGLAEYAFINPALIWGSGTRFGIQSMIFGRGGVYGRGVGVLPGILNRGQHRIGWSWNGPTGTNRFSIHGGTRGKPDHYHIDLTY